MSTHFQATFTKNPKKNTFKNWTKNIVATFSHDLQVSFKSMFLRCFLSFCIFCRRISAESSHRNKTQECSLGSTFWWSFLLAMAVHLSQLYSHKDRNFFAVLMKYWRIWICLLNSFEMFCNCRIYVCEPFGYFEGISLIFIHFFFVAFAVGEAIKRRNCLQAV